MKKVVLGCLAFCITSLLMAQSDSTGALNRSLFKRKPGARSDYFGNKFRSNVIKINLLSPVYSNLSLFLQHAYAEDKSLQIGISYMSFSGIFGTESNDPWNENERTRMFVITPEYRYNLTGMFLEGMYVGTFTRYAQMTYDFDNADVFGTKHYTYNYKMLGLGVTLGMQLLYRNRVSIEGFIGPVYTILLNETNTGYGNSTLNISESIPILFVRGYGLRAGMTVGYAF